MDVEKASLGKASALVPVTPTFKQSFEFKEKMQLLNHLCYKQGSECS